MDDVISNAEGTNQQVLLTPYPNQTILQTCDRHAATCDTPAVLRLVVCGTHADIA